VVEPSLDELLGNGEGQTVEFKESTSLTAQAAQTLVAFANSQGGQVLFGVSDDGRPVGVHVGKRSIEDLIGQLESRIYPSLPMEPRRYQLGNGREVVSIAVPRDKPPVIGCYLYSSKALDPAGPISTDTLKAYRRVGPRSQKVDFMWLRGLLPSDPVVLVDGRAGKPQGGVPTWFRAVVWASQGSAYAITLGLDPPLIQRQDVARDLPTSRGLHWLDIEETLRFEDDRPSEVWLTATYQDDWGCTWESRRKLLASYGDTAQFVPTAHLSRRITAFPPKYLASPAD
jgi:hypothetical protein